MSRIRLCFFGTQQLWVDDVAVTLTSHKGWALLAYVAASDYPRRRDTVR